MFYQTLSKYEWKLLEIITWDLFTVQTIKSVNLKHIYTFKCLTTYCESLVKIVKAADLWDQTTGDQQSHQILPNEQMY